MRSAVYRNLDRPFQILGLYPVELIALCFVLVAGGEVLQLFGVSRFWAFVLTAILSLWFYWVRSSLGTKFLMRLFRFIQLPNYLGVKLIGFEKERQ